jgi:hypothetical protein
MISTVRQPALPLQLAFEKGTFPEMTAMKIGGDGQTDLMLMLLFCRLKD